MLEIHVSEIILKGHKSDPMDGSNLKQYKYLASLNFAVVFLTKFDYQYAQIKRYIQHRQAV